MWVYENLFHFPFGSLEESEILLRYPAYPYKLKFEQHNSRHEGDGCCASSDSVSGGSGRG